MDAGDNTLLSASVVRHFAGQRQQTRERYRDRTERIISIVEKYGQVDLLDYSAGFSV